MRFILLILLLCSFGADAQMIIKAHANYRPYAQPAANLLLDDYPNAAAAYSLRKLDKDYSGSAIRVRRSNDNAESDIGFTSSGDLDTASLKTFVGSNSAFVTTWYDQSGNIRNATQGTAGNQPRIMNAGVVERNLSNKLSIYFNASLSNRLIHTMPDLVASNYFFTAVVQNGFQSSYRGIYSTGTSTNGFMVLSRMNTSSNWGTFGGIDRPSTQNITDRLALITMSGTTNSSGSFFTNGVASGTYAASQAGTKHIGGDAGQSAEVEISELIVYSSNQSSNRIAIENNITTYHNIYTPIWNGDFTGILDTYPNSAAAYSLRNLSSTYKGPLIRVRRSNDNAEQDIFGDYYGNLDTIGLKSFVGANSAFVTTWYDQSGSSRNATQGTAANQPRIANLGVIERQNGKVSTFYDGSNDHFTLSDFALPTSSIFSAANNTVSTSSNIHSIYCRGTSNTFLVNRDALLYVWRTNNTIELQRSDNTSFPTATRATTINSFSLYGGIYTGTQLIAYNNGIAGTAVNTTISGVSSNPVSSVGATFELNTNKYHFGGFISEVIVYASNQSSNRTGIESNINTYYSIY